MTTTMTSNIVELAAIIMFFISFFGLITTTNIIKSMICITLMEVSIVMFWLSFGFTKGQLPPIMESIGDLATTELSQIGDPLPQALMITAIIIGLSVTAVNTIMFITFYRKYKTANWIIAKKRSLEER